MGVPNAYAMHTDHALEIDDRLNSIFQMGVPYAYAMHTDHVLEIDDRSMIQVSATECKGLWRILTSDLKASFVEIGLGFGNDAVFGEQGARCFG